MGDYKLVTAGLQKTLSISFHNTSILEQALMHSSYINESTKLPSNSNEKLEYLGDAVLGLIIADKLYHDYPDFNEGEMTRLRATLVRQDTLARIAKILTIGDYLILGKGEEASGGRTKPTNLSSALEAVTAAIYLDQGFEITRAFVLRSFEGEIQRAVSRGAIADYKSQLQELVQSSHKQLVYNLLDAVGPAHARQFTVEVTVEGRILGSGIGKTKKLAETEAARIAIEKLTHTFTA